MSFETELRSNAKILRKKMTDEETVLWKELRRRRINGIKFRRQHVINGYIVDYYAPEVKLVVEIDGGFHRKNRDHDKLRDKVLRDRGCGVLRFWNSEIKNDIVQAGRKRSTRDEEVSPPRPSP